MVNSAAINPFPLHAFSGNLSETKKGIAPIKFSPNFFNFVTMPLGKLKDCFAATSPLELSLRTLAQDKDLKKHLKDSEFNKQTTTSLIEAFQSSQFSRFKHHLAKIINNMPEAQMDELLKTLFSTSATVDPGALIKKLMGLFTLQKIEAVVQTTTPLYNAKNNADGVAELGADGLETKKALVKHSLFKTAYLYIVNILDWCVNLGMAAFLLNDIGDMDDEEGSSYMASHRITLYLELLASVNLWLLSVSAMIGSPLITAALVCSAILIGSALLYVYFRWIKPCPEECSPCVNYTSEATKGNIAPVLGRDEQIDALVNSLVSNASGARVHPMLLGESGVGKSEIVKGLALRIVEGKVPDLLKNKKVFFVNTAELVPNGGNGGRLNGLAKLQKKFRKHEHEAIFFFDEIHMAWKDINKNGGGAILGEKMKTLLDPGPGGFPFCIGATTPQEYKEYIAGHWAFERRFELVPVEETDIIPTLAILNSTTLRMADDIPVEESAFEAAYNLSKKHFPQYAQPGQSLKILNKAFSKVRMMKNLKTSHEMQKMKDKLGYMASSFSRRKTDKFNLDTVEGKKFLTEYKKLKADIEALQMTIDAEQADVKRIQDYKHKSTHLKKTVVDLAQKITKASKSNQSIEEQLKEYTLLLKYYAPALTEAIKKMQVEIKDTVIEVNEKLIREIIEEDLKNEVKKNETLNTSS